MSIIYKLAGGALLLTAIIAGALWYSAHQYDAGKSYQLALDQAASAKVLQQAKTEQAQADAKTMQDLQDAVKQANLDEQSHQTDLNAAQAVISSLRSRIQTYAKTPADKLWLDTAIPGDILSGLCVYQNGSYTPNCQGNNGPVPAHPSG